jgi:F-type H+-transporting ATPase subunit b
MTAEFWVVIGFLIFVALVLWSGAHKMIAKGLDARTARIAKELEEATRLRVEAEKLLREFEAKRAGAEGEAQAIIRDAQDEAARMKAEAEAKLKEFVARRTVQAEQKIAQAETQAAAEVRASAADAAIKVAETIMRGATGKANADSLIAEGIAEVKTRLN